VANLEQLVQAVVEWFARSARDLPWRRTRDPYAVWVSEVMLQQTQVQTVIPYWQRWMKTLPDIHSLARSPLDQVLRLWEGLGYYRRARNLHRAAEVCRAEHGGKLPNTHQALLSLPGIGRYSAGAIASLAFNQPHPVVDGNVARVLTRIEAIRDPVTSAAVVKRLWTLAGAMVTKAAQLEADGGRLSSRMPRSDSFRNPARIGWCSALNQGLMELGAVVCLRRQPRCQVCPLHDFCLARRKGWQADIPNADRASKPEFKRRLVLILQWKNRLLLRRRPEGALNGGFWEFPEIEAPPEVDGGFLERELKKLKLRRPVIHRSAVFAHAITRYRLRLEAHWLRLPTRPSSLRALRGLWIPLARFNGLPLVGSHRRIARRWSIAEDKTGGACV
jgi:A/G-specific adenine glycosylase